MNEMNKDWLPVKAEARQSWPPRKRRKRRKNEYPESRQTLPLQILG